MDVARDAGQVVAGDSVSVTNIDKYVTSCFGGAATAFAFGSVSTVVVAGLTFWWAASPHAATADVNPFCRYHGSAYSRGSVLGMDVGEARECRLVNGMLVWMSNEEFGQRKKE
ncbi:hypothetical protein D8B24_11420 [Verminephrobacter aporrectodeae subsp. tuberculatae]|nr:hypothetical protein [Verminephrobacter aporrectodeae subsp. tuberculatae]